MSDKKYFSRLILIVLLSFISNKTNGQNLQAPLITDRPDQAESAETILPGYFQIETGFLYNKNTIDINQEIKTYDIANTLVRIGLSVNSELRIGSSFLSQVTSTLNRKKTISGFSGLGIGTKIRLVKNSKTFSNISAIINFKLPVGENSFRPHNIEPELILISSKELTDILILSVNIGSGWNSADDILNYFYSLSLGITLTEEIGSFIEYYGYSSSNLLPANKFDTGITYLIKNNVQFDISTGLDFQTGSSDWFLSTGISFRLPN